MNRSNVFLHRYHHLHLVECWEKCTQNNGQNALFSLPPSSYTLCVSKYAMVTHKLWPKLLWAYFLWFSFNNKYCYHKEENPIRTFVNVLWILVTGKSLPLRGEKVLIARAETLYNEKEYLNKQVSTLTENMAIGHNIVWIVPILYQQIWKMVSRKLDVWVSGHIEN